MKWLSVKQYKPNVGSKVFVRTRDGELWTANYTYEHDVNTDEHEALFVSDMDGMSLANATHFCIPDAVEIAE